MGGTWPRCASDTITPLYHRHKTLRQLEIKRLPSFKDIQQPPILISQQAPLTRITRELSVLILLCSYLCLTDLAY